ncbi:MAG: DUF2088 domain-containing protein [Clostridiales bacterium]|nr:DUF2088 domain-containing protein [Clostridiales bacterium]
MIANGTHRIMKEEEIIQKVGEEVYKKFKIYQHNFMDKNELLNLGVVEIDHLKFPVIVNKKVKEADYIIGIGNIIPHSDAGFSGGAKIIQPGICGTLTTSATHISGALMKEIPLGNIKNNICRKVWKK